ncbi:MAG: hypothetical protein LQ343_002646 [Gyalolechia ehrenbergii]|nr:MAG: hypothetical protein LQ343_002646 [Gyalolechia ehrenbergii]
MCMLSGMKWEVVHSRSGAEVFGGTDFPAGCIRFEHELEAGIWKQRLLVYLQEDENLSYSAGRPESHTKRHLEVVTIFLSSSIATAVRTLADYFVHTEESRGPGLDGPPKYATHCSSKIVNLFALSATFAYSLKGDTFFFGGVWFHDSYLGGQVAALSKELKELGMADERAAPARAVTEVDVTCKRH